MEGFFFEGAKGWMDLFNSSKRYDVMLMPRIPNEKNPISSNWKN
jgi:hypothetical protein